MKDDRSDLLRDLVDPVRSFVDEVHNDTVGDAKKFYAGQARKLKNRMDSSRRQAQIRKAEHMRAQEEQRKRRRAALKRTAIVLAVIAVVAFLVISAALNRGM